MSAIAADTWGITGSWFLGGYAVLVVAAVVLVVRAPGKLDRTSAEPAEDLRAVDLAFLNDGDRLAVTSALASLRTAELVDDDVRPAPQGHLGAGEPGDPVQAALLGALRGAGGRPQALRLSTLIAHRDVYRAVRGVEAGLQDRGLLRTAAEHTAARRWSLPLWALAALGIARIAADAVAGRPYGWLILVTGLALIVAAATAVGGAVTTNKAATATLERARATHRTLATELRPMWPDYRNVDVGLGVALFGWHVLTGAMRPVADAVVVQEVFNPSTGDSAIAG